jgi:hypothetical protein
MSRLQLALNVEDLDEAIAFYSTLFRTTPAKVRPGYANFAITEPPLKLVLFSGAGEPGTINHLGVEVETTDEVAAAITHLGEAGLALDIEEQTDCCYAVQNKVWVNGPDATRWETYVVLADSSGADAPGGPACCASDEPLMLGTKPAQS